VTTQLPTLIVPARLASTRFPRKLLQDFRGVPLIVAVGQRLAEQAPGYPLVFAVDSEELADVLAQYGFHAEITDPNLPSGTDRIATVARKLQPRWVINVQGDEPLVRREHIQLLTELLMREEAPMVTLATPFPVDGNPDNPNEVKVVFNQRGKALYFSRSRIPFDREPSQRQTFHRHLGLYGFTGEFLQTFASLSPSSLEQREKLEQLRALDYGYDILVGVTEHPTIGVDTPEDLQRLRG
jgi:3-deoxy-manno-octulosonate cytidylyltransferase (CMP-KDO synthetase)